MKCVWTYCIKSSGTSKSRIRDNPSFIHCSISFKLFFFHRNRDVYVYVDSKMMKSLKIAWKIGYQLEVTMTLTFWSFFFKWYFALVMCTKKCHFVWVNRKTDKRVSFLFSTSDIFFKCQYPVTVNHLFWIFPFSNFLFSNSKFQIQVFYQLCFYLPVDINLAINPLQLKT